MKQTTKNSSAGQMAPEVLEHISLLTQQLHETLERLGVLPGLQHASEGLPDARSRLNYIAEKTSNAANSVLNLVDAAKEEQLAVATEVRAIAQAVTRDPVHTVASGVLMNFVSGVEERTARVDSLLTDIMLAQDFHDLTGQVIAKVITLAVELETNLGKLMDSAGSGERKSPACAETAPDKLDGPQVSPLACTEVVTSQGDVDDLLASLGL